jgi:prevent-host-death family protein
VHRAAWSADVIPYVPVPVLVLQDPQDRIGTQAGGADTLAGRRGAASRTRDQAALCYGSATLVAVKVASRELRNDTAGVLRRAAAGESVQITVNGEPVAELGPLRGRRSHWTSSSLLVERLANTQADPALGDELRALSGGTDELGRIE